MYMKILIILSAFISINILAVTALSSQRLFEAIEKNNIGQIQNLINQGVDLNTRNARGDTPLIAAILNGKEEIANLLIDQGADINATTADKDVIKGLAPLHWASSIGFENLVKKLVAKGANINIKGGNYNWTPLHWAKHLGNTDIAKILLDAGADTKI